MIHKTLGDEKECKFYNELLQKDEKMETFG